MFPKTLTEMILIHKSIRIIMSIITHTFIRHGYIQVYLYLYFGILTIIRDFILGYTYNYLYSVIIPYEHCGLLYKYH